MKSPWKSPLYGKKYLHEIPMDMSIFGQFPSPSVHRWHRWCYSHAMVPPRHLWAVPCGAATAATARGARAGRIDRLEVRLGWKLGKSVLMEEIKGLNMIEYGFNDGLMMVLIIVDWRTEYGSGSETHVSTANSEGLDDSSSLMDERW